MKISKIEIEGFRGVRDKISLDLASGFTVISGRNGAGKSTICDAVEYALTGNIRGETETKEKGEDHTDYISWRRKSESADRTCVRLNIRRKDGREFTIHRDTKDGLELSLGFGGDGQSAVSQDQAERKLISELCRGEEAPEKPLKRLCETMIFRDERITDLSVDPSERDRYRFIRRGLGTEIFSEAFEKSKEVVKGLESKKEKLEEELAVVSNRLEEIEGEIDKVRKKADDIDKLEESKKFVENELKRANKFEAEIGREEMVDQARRVLINLRENANTIDRASGKYKKLRDKTTKFQEGGVAAKRLERIKRVLELTGERIDEVEAYRDDLKGRLGEFRSEQPDTTKLAELHELGQDLGLRGGSCPLCGEDHSPKEFEKRLRSLRSTVDAIIKEVNELSSRVEKLDKRLDELRSLRDELKSEIDELREEKKDLRSRIIEILSRVKGITDDSRFEWDPDIDTGDGEGSNSIPEVNEKVFEKAANHRRQLRSKLDEHVTDLEASLAYQRVGALRSKRDEAEEEFEKIEAKLERAEELAEEADNLRYRIKEEKEQVHEDRINELAPLFGELYSRLRPHIDWQEIDTKTRGDARKFLRFDVGGENPSLFFSSGQRRAVVLAFLLSVHLGRQWSCLNTLILDDPVQHIDDFRALQLTEVLSAVRREKRQVIVTVEDEALARLLRRRLRSSSEQGGQHVQMKYDAQAGARIKKHIPVEPMPEKVLEPA